MKQTRRQFVRTLFVATAQAAVVGSYWPRKLLAADTPARGLNFLVVGDWGRDGDPTQRRVAQQMGIAGQAIGAKFVLSVGDNFYEHGVKTVDDPQWQTSFEKIYTAPSLQLPWHAILGNHDYHGDCDAQIAYSKTSPRWRMPARYYTRTETIDANTTAEFFFLDTTPMVLGSATKLLPTTAQHREASEKQVAWLAGTLAASTAAWKIVVAHHPVYSGGVHGDTPYIIEHVLPLLEKYGVQAYLNGHDHDLQHLQAGRVNLFCSGAGSTVRETKNTAHTKFARGGCSGFIAATLRANQLEMRLMDDHGQLLYATSVPRNQI